MEAIWSAALSRLRERIGERNFNVWIEPIRCGGEDGELRLEVPSRFFQDWLGQHFLPTIGEIVEEVAGRPCPVRVVVNPRRVAPAHLTAPVRRTARPRKVRGPLAGTLVEQYTFDSFVVGAANDVVVKAAQTVSAAPGRRFNPLFIYGGVGLGKTHLLNAIGHDLLRRWARVRVVVLPSETFMNDLISSMRSGKMNGFRERFRRVDALILDDIQFLANKVRTQEEFFHTFNALYASGKQIVLTSDKPPAAIEGLEQRLRSRFEGGLTTPIHPPTREMRVAILKKKAEAMGFELPEEVAEVLAARDGSRVRELEGMLTWISATAAVRGGPIGPELAREVLPLFGSPHKAVSIERIQAVVSRHYGVGVGELLSHRRDRRSVLPRQVAMYLSRVVAEETFPMIAEKFGGRDHSTVMYSVRVVEKRRAADNAVELSLAALEDELSAAV